MSAFSSGIASVQGPFEQTLNEHHQRKLQESRQMLDMAHQDWFPMIQKYAQGDPSVNDEAGKLALQQYSTALTQALGPRGKSQAALLEHAVEQMRSSPKGSPAPPQPNGSVPQGPPQVQVTGGFNFPSPDKGLPPSLGAPPEISASVGQYAPPASLAPAPPPLAPTQPMGFSNPEQGFASVPQGSPAPSGGIRANPIDVQRTLGQAKGAGELAEFETLLPKQRQEAERIFGLYQKYKASGLNDIAAMDAAMGRQAQYAPVTALNPQQIGVNAVGDMVGQNLQPVLKETAPGAVTTAIPAIPQGPTSFRGGLPPAPGSVPGAQVVASPSALLNPDEGEFLSAAQQVAAAHGIPFNRALNPRDPLAQIPVQYHKEVNALRAEQKADPGMREARMANYATLQAMHANTLQMAQFHKDMAEKSRTDRSVLASQRELDLAGKPLLDQAARIAKLNDTLSQGNLQADSLVGPELLMAAAGGPGFRMNEAEIARAVGGRTEWETLKAKLQKWNTDPNKARSLTPAQQGQIQKLVSTFAQRINDKQEILNSAYSTILGSENPRDHQRAVIDAKKALVASDLGPGLAPAPGTMVKMKAPNGQVTEVAAKDVEHYKSLGAKEVK